ncbi:mapk-regulated corepressor-interacting protein 1 [Venturia canescens]|uniref:mapk-regulated corepressor-interacting protein 1 n=1 Tax=Venturia canescens TaxID=32260 RepID=UPI001C9C4C77|nr:mapk-regulated corepressor-interacting protein 1 [Venturia canescens]XP_043270099.1 mapk-regulated corepressor-interacting protein 1 [Venturia canescens]
MYTVSKGPSKIVAKTRRGISQNLERLETLRDLTRKTCDSQEDNEIVAHPLPKPVFNVNGRSKMSSQRHRIQEVITPEHEQLIKFVYESWSQVEERATSEDSADSECAETRGVLERSSNSSLYYNDGEPNDVLQDFKPFDLESWWGKRLYNNITKSL